MPEVKQIVDHFAGDPGLGREGVAALREIIDATGALAHTETLIGELLSRSLESLESADLDPEARDVLTGLAYAATRRSV